MLRILFLCTGNSCRSQMAEGWARHLKSDALRAESAGIVARGLDPLAVEIMAEAGVDISGHVSKDLSAVKQTRFDFVVTLCGHAHETCPVFPGAAKVIHRGFDDPPKQAESAGNPAEARQVYRRVRDEIKSYVRSLPESLG